MSWEGSGTRARVQLIPVGFPLPDAVVSADTDPRGGFRLAAPEGTYLLLARRGGDFAYFGRNPIQLRGAMEGVHLPLVAAHAVDRRRVPSGEEGLEGRVLRRGEPVPGARVFVYLDPSRGLRGPGYAVSEPADAEGGYRVAVPPGTYFVAARHRGSGWRTGALEPGDLFGVLPEFPLTVGRGERARVDLETVELPDRDQMARYRGRFAVLSGTVVNPAGLPVAGVRVCLYGNPQLLDRPLAVTDPTGPDGTFHLETPRTGVHYLGAREHLGGPPIPGERVGFYRGPQGPAVVLQPGVRLRDLTLVLQEIP